MQIIPGIQLSNCPCCGSANIIRVNGITYNNTYKSLEGYILKKIFNCRKCKERMGLFLKDAEDGYKKVTKVLWLEDVQCNDEYHEIFKKLDDIKFKNIKTKNKKYYEALRGIDDARKQLREAKVKLRIKLKIQKKGMLIRHVY